ncbi:MAG: Ig-like domain-containing protein [Actinomycetota bacterium]|nr:Ig-like domain-containing protein [Actinomycetota bacterium]
MIAATIALVFSVAIAAPAFAQSAPDAQVTSPGDGAIVSGGTTVRAEGSSATGVNRIQLFIEDQLVASKDPSELRQNIDVEYSWDTTRAPAGGGIARNGWYQIRVRVTGTGGSSTDATRNVRVDNDAQAPSGLNVSVSQQTVSLSWSANPEPDINGYRIEADSGSGFSPIGKSGSTSYAYQADPGIYNWRVVALRSSVVQESGKASDPSPTVGATVSAPVARGSGNGSGNGGVNGSNKKVFGGSNKAAKRYVRETKQRFARGFGGFASAGLSLPGAAIGLPRLPDSEVLEWGTYKNKLPYNGLPDDGIELESTELMPLAAPTTTHVMPLDALRLVAAGLLMVVIAGLLQFLALRTDKKDTQPA